MGLHVRHLRELALQLIRGPQRCGTQWIGSLQHEKRMLVFGKQAFEIARGARIRIVGDDQALDRRIGGYLQRAVESCCREEHESSRDPASHAQYAKKDLGERGRGRHIHARNSGPFERAGTARRGMIA